ncbi:MAG: hypothetical protein UR52_C0008G0022 [Candidatus Gottesmanbacteria bacterium GW2011_GWA1_34_13]|uniref:Uncharacterized protein n=1 Tax=Candidatus Gottesmanbacteria bacterium GW2011_GWA1_34_13 TaxID=1618434 RepID=A0A0G0DVY7_9BACT|nr:MAG: hypothetical protein UR52_C0008G0022 [Candidatus Gottesmanbacteria bacterium GW2011_GWA1_34_13]
MGDSIAKGIGEQLGSLGKQIVTEVAKTPGKIIGIDEAKGDGTGGSSNQQGQKTKGQTGNVQDKTQQEEINKQQQLAQARKMLQQMTQPQQQELSIHDQIEQEKMQKQQAAILNQQQANKQTLPKIASRPKPWSILKKQSGSETKQNIKAQ